MLQEENEIVLDKVILCSPSLRKWMEIEKTFQIYANILNYSFVLLNKNAKKLRLGLGY